MSEKMLKFINIDMQMPTKRASNARVEDFKEIYNRFVHNKAKRLFKTEKLTYILKNPINL